MRDVTLASDAVVREFEQPAYRSFVLAGLVADLQCLVAVEYL